jgi:hypothetical protein
MAPSAALVAHHPRFAVGLLRIRDHQCDGVVALLALAGGAWPAAIFAMAVRMAAGLINRIRGAGRSPVDPLLVPDSRARFVGFAVWLAALAGDTVEWRGRKLRLRKDGRISAARAQPRFPYPFVSFRLRLKTPLNI